MTGMATCVAGMLVSSVLGTIGLPLGVPPAPEDPIMSRIAPEHCLFYMSWAGTASPDPKSDNHTEQLLAEPEVQYFLTKCGGFIVKFVTDDIVEKQGGSDSKSAILKDAVLRVFSMSQQPGAVFIAKYEQPRKQNKEVEKAEASDPFEPTKDASSATNDGQDKNFDIEKLLEYADFGAVVRVGKEAPELKAKLKTFFQNYKPKDPKHSRKIEIVPLEGDDWYLRSTEGERDNVIWAFYGNYWIFASDEIAFNNILSRMKTEPPQWWFDIEKKLPIERRAVMIHVDFLPWMELLVRYVDSDSLEEAKLASEVLGFANIKSWTEVWGMEKRGFAKKTLLSLDGEPQGLLKFISEQTLAAKDLAPIPDDAAAALVFKLDLNRAFETVLEFMEKSDSETKQEMLGALDKFEKDLGFDLRKGLLAALGDTWCVYSSADEGGWPIAVTSIRDGAALKMAYGKLLGHAKQLYPPLDPPPSISGDSIDLKPQLEHFSFAGHEVYYLNYGVVAPAWCMTEKEFVVGLMPQSVKAYLARDEKHKSLADLPVVTQLFSGDEAPAGLAYFDSVSCFRSFYNLMLLYGPIYTNLLREQGVEVDLSFMPSPPSIYRHLEPSLITLRRTEYGIETMSLQTIPLPSVQGWIALCLLLNYCNTTQDYAFLEETPMLEENEGETQQHSTDGDAKASNEPLEENPENKDFEAPRTTQSGGSSS